MQSKTETIDSHGIAFQIRRIVGVVLHADRDFETRVQGSGGGGWVGPSGGYVASTTISSTTLEHLRVFVRTAEGQEESINFQNWDLSVRPGSNLVVVTCVSPKRQSEEIMATRNVDTGEERWLDVRTWARRQGLMGGKMRFWPSVAIAALLGGMFAMYTSHSRGLASDPYTSSDFFLSAGIVFLPVLFFEWIFAMVSRVSASEPFQLEEALQASLRVN